MRHLGKACVTGVNVRSWVYTCMTGFSHVQPELRVPKRTYARARTVSHACQCVRLWSYLYACVIGITHS